MTYQFRAAVLLMVISIIFGVAMIVISGGGGL
jgi:uncharacterized membrane protein